MSKTLKQHLYEVVLQSLRDHNSNRTNAAKALGVSVRTIRNYITAMTKDGVVSRGDIPIHRNGKRFELDLTFEELMQQLEACEWSRTKFSKVSGRSFRNVFRLCNHYEKLGYKIPSSRYAMKSDSDYCKKCGRLNQSTGELCAMCC